MLKVALTLILLCSFSAHLAASQAPVSVAEKQSSQKTDIPGKANKAHLTTHLDDTQASPLLVKPVAKPDIQQDISKIKDKSPSNRWNDANWWIVWLTGTLVCIASLQACLFISQLKKMSAGLEDSKVAANAAKIASDAAKASVDAYVASERPFVMIEPRGDDTIDFWAVNRGKSPAHIVFSNPVPFVITPRYEDVPESLNYGFGYDNPHSQQINVQWIPPGGEHHLGTFNPRDTLSYVSEGTLVELNAGTRVLLIYSAFKYRGIASEKTYTSTYCYRRFDKIIRMWGGYGWNQYT